MIRVMILHEIRNLCVVQVYQIIGKNINNVQIELTQYP